MKLAEINNHSTLNLHVKRTFLLRLINHFGPDNYCMAHVCAADDGMQIMAPTMMGSGMGGGGRAWAVVPLSQLKTAAIRFGSSGYGPEFWVPSGTTRVDLDLLTDEKRLRAVFGIAAPLTDSIQIGSHRSGGQHHTHRDMFYVEVE